MKKQKHQYVQPAMPQSGYSFVMAANLYKAFGGYAIYVKYKGGEANKITIKDQTNSYIWLVCPDRELVIVKNNQDLGAFYPWGDSFDEVVDLNMFNDSVCKGMDIEYVMTNYAHSPGTKNSRIIATSPPEERIQFLSDSGGLQLARGLKASIHPIDLVEFYNNNVDGGMVLDLPLHFSDPVITRKAAELQRKNTECMLRHGKGVELINIFHGQSKEERALFRSIAEDKRVPRVALAGIAHHMPITGTNAILETVTGNFRYKQYHILGVYTAPLIPLLVKIANAGDAPPHITSDSTSHIQSSVNKAYHFQFDIFHNMKRIPIGTRGAILNTSRHLPCQCKVCSTLKYMDILGFVDSSKVSEILAIHNAYEMTRYARQLQEIARTASAKEYNDIVAMQLKGNPEVREVKGALEFIDVYAKHGLAAAQKKYPLHLNSRKTLDVAHEAGGLFGTKAVVENKEAKKRQTIIEQIKVMENQLKERS